MIKTKRLNSGYYKGCYNGINFSIVKTETDLYRKNDSVWYWQIGNKVYDLYTTKKQALEAVQNFITETY